MGRTPVARIENTAVQSWIVALAATGTGLQTVTRVPGVLSGILQDAVKDRRIIANPCEKMLTPVSVPKERVYLTYTQFSSLVEDAGAHGSLVQVLGYCGLRWGEAIGLRVKDLGLPRRRLNIEQNAVESGGQIYFGSPKTHECRSVAFPKLMIAGLREQTRDKLPTALVFPGADGRYVRRPRLDEYRGSWFAGRPAAALFLALLFTTSVTQPRALRSPPEQTL